MKALFLLYEGYVDWEVSPLSYILSVTDCEIETTALQSEVTHSGQFTVKVTKTIDECAAGEYDLLILPGGDPEPLLEESKITTLIREFDEKNKWIAAICGASTLLGASSVLREREYSTSIEIEEFPSCFNPSYKSKADVTVCENLITAEGNAYIEFAVAVGKELDLFEDREDELETVLFFKNQLRS
ncbi:DJ-1/PfpI family protein [Pontibacillus salipaludis]|uniref:Glutamine amidotransferase n=1 Tax=Pontibacillus salipaludis TaxID=1697394 RepID=A0ABQ1Q623_9BACI|nr:DJ-1/PfpI family protein [Pontibacillus salipaludis]GGD13332.1 glutamine amidotransferase [Pontibacillus salipaludis]